MREEMSEVETNKDYSKDKTFIKYIFLIFGIGGMLVWNAILSNFDFFNYYFKNPKPPVKIEVMYPFMNFLLNIPFQLVLVCKPKFMSYKIQLLFTLFISMISLALLPISVIYTSSTLGYILSNVVVLILGFINAVCLSSFFGLSSYFPMENIVMMSTGQGLSGILINIIKILTLAILDKSNQHVLGNWIFFSVSFLIMFVSIIAVLLAYKNPYFLDVLKNTDENQDKQFMVEIDKDLPLIEEKETKSDKKVSEVGAFLDLIKKIIDINLVLFSVSTVSLTVFPAGCLTPHLFYLQIQWKAIIIITIFNVCDTLGRNLCGFFKPKKTVLYTIGLARILFVILIPLNVYLDKQGYIKFASIFLLFNTIVLGITHGFCTSLAFSLAPLFVEDNLKGRAGSSVSLFLVSGIFTGTCCAFIMDVIITAIQKK